MRKRGPVPVALLAVAALAAACGGTPFPTAARTTKVSPSVTARPSTAKPAPRKPTAAAKPKPKARPAVVPKITITVPAIAPTTTTAPPAAAPPGSIELTSLLPTGENLGPGWEDDGDPGTSLDVTNPPTPCAAFMAVVNSRTATVLHEFSFLPTADGSYEQGHMNILAIRAASPAAVTTELAAVSGPSFAACAQASATRRYQETETGTIDGASAKLITLPVVGRHVFWRATVASHTPDGVAHTTYMDVGYLVGGGVLVKIRIASCGCRPPASDGELLPGELNALSEIAHGLSPSAISG